MGITPPVQAHATCQHHIAIICMPTVTILCVGLHASAVHVGSAFQRVVECHFLWEIRHAVAHRVAPFPFVDTVVYDLHLSAHAPLQGVLAAFPLARVRQGHHTGLQGIACMFV